MNETDAARRRDLQRRAFAPGGGLTDAETAELRALTETSAARSAPAATVPAAASKDQTPVVVAPGEALEPLPQGAADGQRADSADVSAAGVPGSAASAALAENPASAASGSRRRVGLSIVAAAATLLLGFGAGWLVFGRASGPQMSAEQQKTFAEIESSNEYDPGSLTYLGSEQELSVWQATDAAGELRCIILTAAERKEHTCIAADDESSAWSLQASLALEDPDGASTVAFWATILDDVDGNPVASVERQEMVAGAEYDWRANFVGTELEIAEVINSQGYDGEMLQVVGYDGETPIWLHDGAQPCIIRADTERLLMANCGEYSPEGVFEVQDNAVLYSLKQTENRGPMLTITRTGTIPLDQGGEQIDDKTGEVVE